MDNTKNLLLIICKKKTNIIVVLNFDSPNDTIKTLRNICAHVCGVFIDFDKFNLEGYVITEVIYTLQSIAAHHNCVILGKHEKNREFEKCIDMTINNQQIENLTVKHCNSFNDCRNYDIFIINNSMFNYDDILDNIIYIKIKCWNYPEMECHPSMHCPAKPQIQSNNNNNNNESSDERQFDLFG